MIDERAIGERFRVLAGEPNERRRPLWAAEAQAQSRGRGGAAATARAAGIHLATIWQRTP